jgi:hypothetical protein
VVSSCGRGNGNSAGGTVDEGIDDGCGPVEGLTVDKMSDDVAGPVVTTGTTVGVGAAAGLDIVGVSDGVVITCAGWSGVPVLVQPLTSTRTTEAKAVRLIIRFFL